MAKYRVHSKLGRPFRRLGVVFDVTPQIIDTEQLGWSPEELAEFLRPEQGAALYIEPQGDAPKPRKLEELQQRRIVGRSYAKPGTPSEAVAAAEVAGESLPGHPSRDEAEELDATIEKRGRRTR
jgi:hypothetical protein